MLCTAGCPAAVGGHRGQVGRQVVGRAAVVVAGEARAAAVVDHALEDRGVQRGQRVAAAAGGDQGDRAVLAEQLGVAGPHAAHRLDHRLVGGEHRHQPGQAALGLLDVDDVGLVDAALRPSVRGVVDLDRDDRPGRDGREPGQRVDRGRRSASAWASGSASASRGVGARDRRQRRRRRRRPASTDLGARRRRPSDPASEHERERADPERSATRRVVMIWPNSWGTRVVDVEELRQLAAARPGAAVAASGVPAAHGCRAPRRCRTGGRSRPGPPPRAARPLCGRQSARRSQPASSATARPTSFSAACRSSPARSARPGRRPRSGLASASGAARTRPGRISAACRSAATRRTSWASSAAWAASTRACSRSRRDAVKVIQAAQTARPRNRDKDEPAGRGHRRSS